jgi:hypothetical protein
MGEFSEASRSAMRCYKARWSSKSSIYQAGYVSGEFRISTINPLTNAKLEVRVASAAKVLQFKIMSSFSLRMEDNSIVGYGSRHCYMETENT